MDIDRRRAVLVSGAAALLAASIGTSAALAAPVGSEPAAPPAVTEAAEAAEPAEAAEAAEPAEADVPGGHEDADGVDVNHEFEGEE